MSENQRNEVEDLLKRLYNIGLLEQFNNLLCNNNVMTYTISMKNDLIQVRIDPKVKEEAETIINEMGLTLSSAIQLYLSQIIQKHEIPFKIVASRPNLKTRLAIQEAKSISASKKSSRTYSSHTDLVREIRNELTTKK